MGVVSRWLVLITLGEIGSYQASGMWGLFAQCALCLLSRPISRHWEHSREQDGQGAGLVEPPFSWGRDNKLINKTHIYYAT